MIVALFLQLSTQRIFLNDLIYEPLSLPCRLKLLVLQDYSSRIGCIDGDGWWFLNSSTLLKRKIYLTLPSRLILFQLRLVHHMTTDVRIHVSPEIPTLATFLIWLPLGVSMKRHEKKPLNISAKLIEVNASTIWWYFLRKEYCELNVIS